MSHVDFSVTRHIARVHLNRPDALNAITPEMDDALALAWRRINEDSDIWVALLSAEGERAFCAGADLDSLSTAPAQAFGGGLTGIGGRLVELRKPLVAAVQGYAIGGGFELALCADLLVVSDTVRFRLPEVSAGLIDHSGVLHRAFRKLPYNVAMELVLTGRELRAHEAQCLGLANRVVGWDQLHDAALELCEKLLEAPPLATQAAKEAANDGLDRPLGDALGRTYPAITRFRNSHDASEAMEALSDRRTPEWSGT
jgi:crotonobetainyl-CoA hydratase